MMWKVSECAVDISLAQRARLDKLSSSLLCDGMQALGLPDGCMRADIKCINSSERLVGTAYTVKATEGNSLPVHYAIYNARPGYVLVVDTGRYEHGPYLGELMALNAMHIGLQGLVVDGYVRDAAALRRMEYPIFCRGYMPRKPSKERRGGINLDIECGGVRVCPGDVIVGDEDGVVVIPRGALDEVINAAERKDAADEQRKADIVEFYAGNFANRLGRDMSKIIPADMLI